MVITHYGMQFFKVSFGDTTIALDPISKNSKLKGPKFGADIAISSANHSDMNGVLDMSFGDKKPFTIVGPGEYEIGGIFIKGFASKTNYGGKEMNNTIYLITLEDMNLIFLGALSNSELPNEVKEAIDDVDILFAPIGGDGVLSPAEAHKLAVKLEPKIIIPMHMENGGGNALKTFLKEEGLDSVKPVDKLTIKKKDLVGKDGEIIVLSNES